MGNYKTVVEEQLALMARVGLTTPYVTHVGEGLAWVKDRAEKHGIALDVRRTDPNVMHYETFAMLLIEELVKKDDRPILYWHTKGVSNPTDPRKPKWRRLMQRWVVERWRENLKLLENHDAVGVDWLQCQHSHFVGTFWMARADYLRRQEPFHIFHRNMNFTRFSCEFWIGWGNPRVYSHVCRNLMWYDLIDRFGDA